MSSNVRVSVVCYQKGMDFIYLQGLCAKHETTQFLLLSIVFYFQHSTYESSEKDPCKYTGAQHFGLVPNKSLGMKILSYKVMSVPLGQTQKWVASSKFKDSYTDI